MIDLSGTQTAAQVFQPLGVVQLQGPDSAKFLQGQLSADMVALAAGSTVLAGYHNVQGRTIALLRVSKLDADELLLTLPRELVADVIARLTRYVLRAKTSITDVSAQVTALGLAQRSPPRADQELTTLATFQWGRTREVMLVPRSARVAAPAAPPSEPHAQWHRADIADGLPQVFSATSEAFVAQMLNLDALGGIAFDKGCYTGQEVIARAHYRGRVKRRLQRFVLHGAMPAFEPGAVGTLADGRAFKVVDAVALADRRCEWLAVAPLSGDASERQDNASSRQDAAHTPATQLPLPYALAD